MEVTVFPVRTLEAYRAVLGDEKFDVLQKKAEPLRGMTLGHYNATAFGGGVAEILQNFVPLLCDAGIETHWHVMEAPNEFFDITKKMHNALQGNQALALSEEERRHYLQVNEQNAQKLKLDYDVVIVDDPQPAAMVQYVPEKKGPWLWRCHIDMSTPNMAFWGFLSPFVHQYDRYIFHRPDYAREDLPPENVIVMPPSIDPLSEKNFEMEPAEVERVVRALGVDLSRPILMQVGRFDPWKGIFDVIDIYKVVKQSVPEVQLVFPGIMATDDPEGWIYFERTLRRIGEDADVHVLTNLTGVMSREVNALQRAATVILQMSTREGFGLTVSEAMWKRKPVIGRAVGGIKLQVVDGDTGFLVADAAEAAERAIYLLRHPEVTQKMGESARARVMENFLITTQLSNYIDVINEALHRQPLAV